ncbi:uncharacterized protein [Anabrus simplex]|uniref:uncharacterized protein isoform X2 n=1 Tax=Anabrus simplex TaxID=316456 RepID=UPI0035A2FEEB
MDLEVQIKEEPVLVEGTPPLENFQPVSEVISLKQETKSELTEPGATLENAFEGKIFVEEHQMVPNIKEETNFHPGSRPF